MLKIRGMKSDINDFLKRLQSDSESDEWILVYEPNNALSVQKDRSTETEKAAEITDLYFDDNFNVNSINYILYEAPGIITRMRDFFVIDIPFQLADED